MSDLTVNHCVKAFRGSSGSSHCLLSKAAIDVQGCESILRSFLAMD